MKIGDKELSELTDTEIILNYNACLDIEASRLNASKNPKFDTTREKGMNFPDANPAFIEKKIALIEEMKKRKIGQFENEYSAQ